jgi:ligand-binding sensor domain-containing protein/signal transduction histidine kinase
MIVIHRPRARRLCRAGQIALLWLLHPWSALAGAPPAVAVPRHGSTRVAYPATTHAFAEDRTPLPPQNGFHQDHERTPTRHRAAAPAVGGPPDGDVPVKHLRFSHLTTNDGLSQSYVTAIVQDRLGFMWFATRDGLNRFDGNAFVVYKNDPNDAASLNSNFIQDLVEDRHGALWIATNTGVNRFDPATERCTRYLHDRRNPDSLGGASVKSIATDSDGSLWIGTEDAGLDRLDPTTGRFTHYRNDSEGRFVGRITQVIAGPNRDVWVVGERGLFQLNRESARLIPRPSAGNGLSATSVYQDERGTLWMLVDSPTVALVRYVPQNERVTTYPVGRRGAEVLASTTNGGSANGSLAADGQHGFWVPSGRGLYYFDRQTERFTYHFEHDDSNPASLDANAVLSVYRDRGGVLWVGTENAGLNLLDFEQQQFGLLQHRPADPTSLSPGRVKAIHQDPDGILWVGLFPRALDRVDPKTGEIVHYLPRRGDGDTLGEGTNVNSIYRDAKGYLWVGGGGSGLERLDERTGRFKSYRHKFNRPDSLISDNVYTIFGDRKGQMWVGLEGGISRFNPATDTFVNYRPVPDDPASLSNTVWIFHQDRSGALWSGTWGGTLVRFDEAAETFVTYPPDSNDPDTLKGGGINSIHEDRTGTLWVGTFDGLYRYNRHRGSFVRFTERQGLPSSSIRCILEDGAGRLWLSTQRGISRFDPRGGSFRNYDVSDGLQSNEFSTGCYQAPDGEMYFGGSDGLNAFVPADVRDSAYVPPVVITGFKIFNRPVPIGVETILEKAIPYVDSLTIPYRYNVFSFEFAALSYANAYKNGYRYTLEHFDSGWNDVGSRQRLASYTNLDPGTYVFRVQGSNSDGVWNERGVSLRIVITPPWWKTASFRALCVCVLLGVLWTAHLVRLHQVQRAYEMTLEARVGERTRIARDLHDTLLQSFHGLLLRFQTVSYLLPQRPAEAKGALEGAIHDAATALIEGRDAVQGLRASVLESNDLAAAIRTLGDELATDASSEPPPAFQVAVEGQARDLHAIVRDDIYKVAAEALRNAFRHADAGRVEVEIRYDHDQFRLRVRDDGKGIEPAVLARQPAEGHYGLRGMPERAALIGGTLAVWSEVGAGTEIELRLPASSVYLGSRMPSWFSRLFAPRTPADS